MRVSWDDPIIQFMLVSTLLNLVLMVWILWVSFSALHQEKTIGEKVIGIFCKVLKNWMDFITKRGASLVPRTSIVTRLCPIISIRKKLGNPCVTTSFFPNIYNIHLIIILTHTVMIDILG